MQLVMVKIEEERLASTETKHLVGFHCAEGQQLRLQTWLDWLRIHQERQP